MEATEMSEKRPLTAILFLLRLLSGVIGGAAGTLALFIAYFILLNVVPESEAVTSLSLFVIIIMAFIGTITANTITGLMVTFMDNAKYSRRKTIVMHIFLFNFILFFLTIPLYLLGVTLDIANEIVAVHFLLSAFISMLIMEILAGRHYSLLGMYSAALGIFISIGLALAILSIGLKPIIIIFAAMPGVWFILQLVGGVGELIYDNFLRFYGVDAMNVETDLGGDEEKESDRNEEEDEDDDEDDK